MEPISCSISLPSTTTVRIGISPSSLVKPLFSKSPLSSFRMQLSAFLASTLLLAIPSLVGAAPTDDACSLNARDVLSARAPTCNPPKPNPQDAAAVKKYNDLMAKMSDATKAAHAGSCACPASKNTDFQKSKDKNLRTTIKNTCVNGYQTYVTLII